MNAMELSGALADVVEATARSVVRLGGRSAVSGAIFSEQGHVVAIDHTLDRDDVEVGLPDGRTVAGHVVGRDSATDLALVRTEASGLTVAPWIDAGAARVGELLLAVYRPGRTPRAALGAVAALGDDWRTRFGGRIDRYIEASLPLRPGFSGGLLVTASGGALALVTTGLVRGVPLGIPASTVKRVAQELLSAGHVRRGYLGVISYPVALPPGLQSSLGQAAGLLVLSIEAASPADSAHLLQGDVIVGVEGRGVSEPSDLLASLDEDQVGREIALRVVRAGEVRDLRVTVGERGPAA
jgi:S1-C subfamily serine protease